uniref:CUE domain-containing protein n=1 Tax=Plectus sambesii TaxID=2011161 RepID=A0A914W4F2_9BILA
MASHSSKQRPAVNSIDELFTIERWSSVWWKSLLLFIYSPIGVILLLLRVILGIHVFIAACILRKTMFLRCAVLRIMCTLLGIVIVQESKRDKSSNLIVANHVSVLDHMAVDLVEPCILPSVWDIPNLLRWCLGYTDLGARRGRQTLIDQAKIFCQTSPMPLLALPEGAMTNGQRGMLKFSSWSFDVTDSVQPLLISTWRPPFAQVATSVLGGSWWQDTLWYLFSPFTIIRLRWLPSMTRQDSENAEDFCRRVAQAMAEEAGLALTNYTSQDAVEAAKRHIGEQERLRRAAATRQQANRTVVSSADLDAMAMRVKELFPAVSLLVIRDDLDKTKSIDVTSNNILEGVLKQEPTTSSSKKAATNKNDPASWRALYEERKWNMIEENRQKYIKRKELKL